jgi:hypothetical protein
LRCDRGRSRLEERAHSRGVAVTCREHGLGLPLRRRESVHNDPDRASFGR